MRRFLVFFCFFSLQDLKKSLFPSIACNISAALVFVFGCWFAPKDYYDILVRMKCFFPSVSTFVMIIPFLILNVIKTRSSVLFPGSVCICNFTCGFVKFSLWECIWTPLLDNFFLLRQIIPVCGFLLCLRTKDFDIIIRRSKGEGSLNKCISTLVLGLILYYRALKQLPLGKRSFWIVLGKNMWEWMGQGNWRLKSESVYIAQVSLASFRMDNTDFEPSAPFKVKSWT